jgi:2-keto-4-pentenoate hydratase/2-oxohepta-3-ene-1,7-dioic acid hydratase in catechol pathway
MADAPRWGVFHMVFEKSDASTSAPDRLHAYVFGVTIANEVSARDLQLPQTRFFQGKRAMAAPCEPPRAWCGA